MVSRAAVIGAGSWGTALAKVLGDQGHRVGLWSHNDKVAEQIRGERVNGEYLPGIELPQTVEVSLEYAQALDGAELVLEAVPSHALRAVLTAAEPYISDDALIVTATKGLEVGTLERPSEILAELLPDRPAPAALSGPSFALEVAEGDLTAIVVASNDSEVALRVQAFFNTERFRVYTNDDILGVELAAALKNVIALAAGMADGLGYRSNSRAALITRGLAEITRLGVSKGAHPTTFAGLAGLGDLVLTCTANLSRNRRVGLALGRGEPLDRILAGMKMVAEGVRTTKAARELARAQGVEMPIVEEIHAILYEGKSPAQAAAGLMLREPKPEIWGASHAT